MTKKTMKSMTIAELKALARELKAKSKAVEKKAESMDRAEDKLCEQIEHRWWALENKRRDAAQKKIDNQFDIARDLLTDSEDVENEIYDRSLVKCKACGHKSSPKKPRVALARGPNGKVKLGRGR